MTCDLVDFIQSELILLEMLNDITLTTTIAAHREIKRGRVVCGTCGKR
jgi:hypothetical protein